MKKINNINGIALHYARLTNHPYGSKGQLRDFMVEETFLNSLKKCFEEVFEKCPLGIPEIITTAGIFVNKPGQHGHGRAFDLDAIFWQDHSLVTLNFVHQKELYIGIESILRKHFGLVLNHFYPNHKDHWHMDSSVTVDYNESSQSETLYVQMALKYIYREEILVDGLWGPQTKGMVKTVFDKLQIPTPITTKKNYVKFLDLTGKIAFRLSEQKNSPIQLIANLTEVLENLPLQHRNEALQALNSFLDHNETTTWLNGFHTRSDDDINTIIAAMIG